MKVALCYIAVTHGENTSDFAARFVATYHQFPPGVDHDTFIICNGGPLETDQALLFTSMNAKFWPHANDDGFDISAYIDAAKGPCRDYDMMLCLGESNHFHRAGWLRRLTDAWTSQGRGMYGPYSSHAVRAHLNTTAFCSDPKLIANYPRKVACRKDRYEFEHGEHSFWRWVDKRRLPVRLVTWDGIWPPKMWRVPQNILWRGTQENILFFCNHSQRYQEIPAERKRNWERSTDRPFK